MNEATAAQATSHYDVVVIGGAFAGASLATLVRRWCPESRVLIVERQADFGRKVGEATVEVSALFLHRVLGLYHVLARHHLPKHGLRYWFTDAPERSLTQMSEVGAGSLPLLPAFLLDRALFDSQLLTLAATEGAEVMRPCRVIAVEPAWPSSQIRLEDASGERQITARWVIDASGRHAFLARRWQLHQKTMEHPTAAVWARWKNVADLDSTAVLGADPRTPVLPGLICARRLGTNHFCGYGWWIWVIALAGGETSIGLVYQKELFELPGSGSVQERYRHFVTSQAGLRELLAQAEMDPTDWHTYQHLPYKTTRYMDRGWALVGDAASFLDPYYSPGLDHASMSVYATARLLEEDLREHLDEPTLGAHIEAHNQHFLTSYERWLRALYTGKYELFGDAELTACAFLLDTSLYYLGVVTPVYSNLDMLRQPLFGPPTAASSIGFRVMHAFKQRLIHLARSRRQRGTYGQRNLHWRFYSKAPGLGSRAIKMLRQGLWLWLCCEWEAFLGHFDFLRPKASRPLFRSLDH